jgi:hypothetical protein
MTRAVGGCGGEVLVYRLLLVVITHALNYSLSFAALRLHEEFCVRSVIELSGIEALQTVEVQHKFSSENSNAELDGKSIVDSMKRCLADELASRNNTDAEFSTVTDV